MPAGYDGIGRKTQKAWSMKPKARAGRGNPPSLRGAWKLQKSRASAPPPTPTKSKAERSTARPGSRS